MEPVPTSFHLGPFEFHAYGIGLAIAGYVAFRYAEYRFTRRGLSIRHFGMFTLAMLALGVVGARIAHVLTNWTYYQGHFGEVPSVWQGGLSSFGGIVLAAPVGYVLARRWWPEHRRLAFTDALFPAIIAGWALGRLLGPQFMVAGGGHVTHQWFGMHYAGQIGARVPVPIIQALEDGILWLGVILLEHRRGKQIRVGLVTGIILVAWGVVRAIDERLLLGQNSWTGSIGVQIAGIVLAATGLVILVSVARNPSAQVKE